MAFSIELTSQLRLPTLWSKSVKTQPFSIQFPQPSTLTLHGSQKDYWTSALPFKRSALASSQRRNFTGTNHNLQKIKYEAKESDTPLDPLDVTELKLNVDKAIEQLKLDLSKLRGGGRFDHAVVETLRVQPQKGSKETVKLGTLAQIVPKSRFLNVVVGELEVTSAAKLFSEF